MDTTQQDFHLEEFKQLRSEVVGLVAKAEQQLRYAGLLSTGVYSWLLINSMGTTLATPPAAAMPCIKFPLVLIWIGWTIPPIFTGFAGLLTFIYSIRIRQLGTYLRALEDALGRAPLGWEKHSRLARQTLTWTNKAAWTALLCLCVTVSGIGIYQANSYPTYCATK